MFYAILSVFCLAMGLFNGLHHNVADENFFLLSSIVFSSTAAVLRAVDSKK